MNPVSLALLLALRALDALELGAVVAGARLELGALTLARKIGA